MKKTKTSLARKIFIVFDYLVLIFLAVVCLLPILHVAFASVSDPNWVMNQSGLILKSHGFTLEGYKLVFQTRQLMGSYGNTLFYVFASTALGMHDYCIGSVSAFEKRSALVECTDADYFLYHDVQRRNYHVLYGSKKPWNVQYPPCGYSSDVCQRI